MNNVPSYRIVAGSARNHSENVWSVEQQYSARHVTLGQGIQPGMLIGRKNAINLAVWLLRAFGVTPAEVADAMGEATSAPMHQGFRAFFGDDEP